MNWKFQKYAVGTNFPRYENNASPLGDEMKQARIESMYQNARVGVPEPTVRQKKITEDMRNSGNAVDEDLFKRLFTRRVEEMTELTPEEEEKINRKIQLEKERYEVLKRRYLLSRLEKIVEKEPLGRVVPDEFGKMQSKELKTPTSVSQSAPQLISNTNVGYHLTQVESNQPRISKSEVEQIDPLTQAQRRSRASRPEGRKVPRIPAERLGGYTGFFGDFQERYQAEKFEQSELEKQKPEVGVL